VSDKVSPAAPRARDAAAPPGPALLEASGLSKRYGAVPALREVSLRLVPGEVHALVGENGSGKSTFVGIVSGTVARDAGAVTIAGTPLVAARPRVAQALGAVTVYQDGSLIGELSVAQNLYLGSSPRSRPRYGRIAGWAARMLAGYGLDLDVELPAAALPPGDRQLVEIIRAVAGDPRVLILDEATSALGARGVDLVLDLIRRVAARGSAVLFVTHRLSEVMRVADTVSVLRDGRHQGTWPAAAVTPHRLVEVMAGTRVDLEFPDRPEDPEAGPVLLHARGLAGAGFGPVDTQVRAGQIVGIAGADGNGQLALLKGLAALGGEASGAVTAGGRTISSYRGAIGSGVLYLSANRRTESLFGGLSIGDNLGIGVLDKLSDGGVMRLRRERSFVAHAVQRYRIRLGHTGQTPAELSGGNQQKVALSRVLAMEPRVVLIDEPTQGVDVRSRMDIYRFLRAIADGGSAVVVVSSDASELAGLCDRILVMSRGRVTAELAGRSATEESIVSAFAVEHELATERDVVPDGRGAPAGPAPGAAGSGAAGSGAAGSGAAGSGAADSAVAGSGAVGSGAPAAPHRGWRSRLSADGLRLGALVALMVLLALFAQSRNDTFLTTLSLFNVMLVALPLVAVAAAQYFVLLVGGIDVSVGATMTLAIVLMSFWAQQGGSGRVLLTGLLVVLACGAGIGGLNALLVERIGLSAVIATIATLGVASGLALMLRPTAAGIISPQLGTLLMNGRVGPVPVALVVLLVLLVVADAVFRRTGFGLRLRAVGLSGAFAVRLGIPAVRVRAVCYMTCAALAGLAGILLAAQVGIGDPNAGNSFTLLAIAAPVLGGAVLSGGHGSLLGAAVGAFILVISQNLVTVLGLSDGTSYLFAGGLTLLALLSSGDSLGRLRRALRARARRA
jgi:ribose transport system permease protein/ribose transport system ATP-binding protein